MFVYEKKLQYPVKIRNCNPKLASFIISQYGGPDGELAASIRYLSQRFAMPYPELKGLLTDIGIEDKYCAFGNRFEHRKRTLERVLFVMGKFMIYMQELLLCHQYKLL